MGRAVMTRAAPVTALLGPKRLAAAGGGSPLEISARKPIRPHSCVSQTSTNGPAKIMMRRTCAKCLASASRRLDIVLIPCRVALRPISTSTPAFARSKPSAVVSSRIEGQYSQQDADLPTDNEIASLENELDENVRQLPEVLPLPNEQYISSWTVSHALAIPLTTVHRRP